MCVCVRACVRAWSTRTPPGLSFSGTDIVCGALAQLPNHTLRTLRTLRLASNALAHRVCLSAGGMPIHCREARRTLDAILEIKFDEKNKFPPPRDLSRGDDTLCRDTRVRDTHLDHTPEAPRAAKWVPPPAFSQLNPRRLRRLCPLCTLCAPTLHRLCRDKMRSVELPAAIDTDARHKKGHRRQQCHHTPHNPLVTA